MNSKIYSKNFCLNFIYPNPSDPLNQEAADLYLKHKKNYDEKVKNMWYCMLGKKRKVKIYKLIYLKMIKKKIKILNFYKRKEKRKVWNKDNDFMEEEDMDHFLKMGRT